MATSTFNLGRDSSVVVIAPTGQRIDFSIVTGFDAKQTVHQLRIKPLTGPPQGVDIPDGWTGSFEIERGSSAADDLFSSIEQGFWATGALGIGQIFQYIQEVNGSTSTYQYDGVAMHLSDAGSYKADASVKQTIAFFASTRKRV
jgi:hypothetical protein